MAIRLPGQSQWPVGFKVVSDRTKLTLFEGGACAGELLKLKYSEVLKKVSRGRYVREAGFPTFVLDMIHSFCIDEYRSIYDIDVICRRLDVDFLFSGCFKNSKYSSREKYLDVLCVKLHRCSIDQLVVFSNMAQSIRDYIHYETSDVPYFICECTNQEECEFLCEK